MVNYNELGTLVGGGDCQEHYHSSDRFPPRSSLLWMWSLEKVTKITDNYSVTSNDDIVVVDATGKTVTLPVALNGRHIIISRLSGTNTIVPSGADTIAGGASVTLDSSKTVWRLKAISGGWIEV